MSVSNIRRIVLAGALFAMIGVPLPASAADVVKLAAITRTVFYVPLWVAMHKGFLKDEGLDVQVTFFDNAGRTADMLRTGEMQFVLRSPEAAIMDAYRGGSLRVIAGGVSRLPHFVIAQPRIKTLADLRGANFGVLAEKEGTTYIVQDIAKAAGLGPDDYKISVVGGSPTKKHLLKEGKIDVGLQPIPKSYEPRCLLRSECSAMSKSTACSIRIRPSTCRGSGASSRPCRNRAISAPTRASISTPSSISATGWIATRTPIRRSSARYRALGRANEDPASAGSAILSLSRSK